MVDPVSWFNNEKWWDSVALDQVAGKACGLLKSGLVQAGSRCQLAHITRRKIEQPISCVLSATLSTGARC